MKSLICFFILILIIILTFVLLGYRENFNNNNYVKIIWMYWEQGEENLKDEYNKMCIYGWRTLNPDWDIRVLDKKTALKYVPELKHYDHLIVQHRADLLRIKLLSKYGGVWADASTLPMKPLNEVINHIDNGTNIFMYRFIPKKDVRMISNWFIISKQPNNYLIKQWEIELEKEFNKIKSIFI
jgi:hypothetical protein